MQDRPYEINDVLLISHRGLEVIARVAGYSDSLDYSKPFYVNLRTSGGQRWGERQVKIASAQVVKPLPDWYTEQKAEWEAELKAHADEMWAKMTEAEKRRVHEEAVALGFAQEQRSPLDILIDRAVGRE